MRSRSTIALLLLTALLLGACGGGGDQETTSYPSLAQKQSTAAEPKATSTEAKPSSQDQAEDPAATTTAPSQGPGSASSPAPVAPGSAGHPVPGAMAPAPGVPLASGGDESIQTFGTEGEEAERQQAEASLRSYLEARAQGNWPAACEAASEQYRSQLAQAIARTPDDKEPEGCPQTLQALFGETPPSTLGRAAQIEQVLSFRIREDGYAYLIFEAPEGKVKFIAMANDDGAWKVNTIEPEAFEGIQGETQ